MCQAPGPRTALHPQTLIARLKTWVTKKIAELLGEEEATFIDFILGVLVEWLPWHLKSMIQHTWMFLRGAAPPALLFSAMPVMHGVFIRH